MLFWSPPQPYRSLMVIGVAGEPTHVNSIRSQSSDGSVVPNSVPATWKRGTSSMPTLLSWRWMISNVSARSWLPVVVPKRNDSLPTFGHEKMSLLPPLGRSGPPVQPLPFRIWMTLVWLNLHFLQFCLYDDSKGLNMWLCSGGRPGAISL